MYPYWRRPEVEALQAQITAQGETVRTLKANKDPAAKVAVAELLALKEKLKVLTGESKPVSENKPATEGKPVKGKAAAAAQEGGEVIPLRFAYSLQNEDPTATTVK
jgi:hypothetical protein